MKLARLLKLIDDKCYMRFIANDCNLSGCYKNDLQDRASPFYNHEVVEREVESIKTILTKSDFNDNIAYGELCIYLGKRGI